MTVSRNGVPRITAKSKDPSPIPTYKILDKALVDNEQWYTVRVYCVPIMTWARASNRDWWYEHPNNGRDGIIFDMHEKLFTMLSLRWGQ